MSEQIVDGIDLSTLSLDELKALKRRWYERARADGSLAAIARVARTLGTERPKKHGSTCTWESEGITISLDTWTGLIGVRVGDRTVCSTGYSEGLFVPGPWLDVVRRADVEAQTRLALSDGRRDSQARADLLRQLGG